MTTCHICKQDHDYKTCPNRYRVLSNHGMWLTSGLFKETDTAGYGRYIYTLKPYDLDDNLPSLQKLYLGYDDLTEYQFANECLGGWDHWQTILGSANEFIQKAIVVWRTELEVKLKAEAFRRIKEEAEADGRNGFAANKYIIERSWAGDFARPKTRAEDSRKGRGRPSKDEVKAAAAEIALRDRQVQEDFDRLGLNDDRVKQERPNTAESA